MKACAEANADSVYNNDSFNNFSSSPPANLNVLNGESEDKEKLENSSQVINGFPGKANSSGFSYTIIPNDISPEKELRPLHFDTNEVLDETPAILKSLSLGGRGPDTFVYFSSPQPTSLAQNDDPFKTFVITNEKTLVKQKNCVNQPLAVNVDESNELYNQDENTEYLSYVIEKEGEKELKKMKEENCNGKNASVQQPNLDEVDHAAIISSQIEESETIKNQLIITKENFLEKNNFNEGEICDKNVQRKIEKIADDSAVLSFDKTITGKKEQTFAKLQDELQKAHQELKLKDEEVSRLTRIREDVERELEELTASLFQTMPAVVIVGESSGMTFKEAHKMVSKAKEKQAVAEKSLKESQMKVEVLTAEVVALKTLVLTSTPSRPNPHLHPQIGREENAGGVNLFTRKHRRSPSHFNLKYGRENSPPESPTRDEYSTVQNTICSSLESRENLEVDPIVHKEFLHWTLNCKLDKTDPFIDRIYREDINLCLDFNNRELAEEVQKAIETRNIYIEAVTDKSKSLFPRKCALLEVTRQCHYRMKLGDQDIWYNISQMCRNRIIAVCDFINYLRYIELGLVKSSAHDMYWEIMRLRKEMVLARLGLSLSSQ